MIREFRSYFEFLQYAETLGQGYFLGDFGAELKTAQVGNPALVKFAESMFEEIEEKMPETLGMKFFPSPFGAYVNVPEYLSGSPTPMRAMSLTRSTSATVRVIVSLSFSGWRNEQLLTRGVASLALAMKLQQFRPVSLLVFDENPMISRLSQNDPHKGVQILLVPIESRPLDLAMACNALANPNFARGLLYYLSIKDAGTLGQNPPEAVIRTLGITGDDVYLPPVTEYTDRKVVDHPVEWVNDELRRIIGDR